MVDAIKYQRKIMKIIKSFIFVGLIAFIAQSCVEPEDLVTEDAKDVGVVLDNGEASGKILGLPNADETVTFLDVALNLRMEVYSGDESRIASYRVVKTFSGENGSGQVDVGTFTEAPFEIDYANINDFLEGIDGVTPDDLRIGDLFSFTTYVTTTSGEEYQYAPNIGSLNVSVNCLSELAGKYSITGTSVNVAYTDTYPGEVFETGPGEYYFIPTSADLSTRRAAQYRIATVFTDLCGELTIPSQNLGGEVEASSNQFSNVVVGSGSVDPVTGVISIEYTIEGLGPQIDVFTPID